MMYYIAIKKEKINTIYSEIVLLKRKTIVQITEKRVANKKNRAIFSLREKGRNLNLANIYRVNKMQYL